MQNVYKLLYMLYKVLGDVNLAIAITLVAGDSYAQDLERCSKMPKHISVPKAFAVGDADEWFRRLISAAEQTNGTMRQSPLVADITRRRGPGSMAGADTRAASYLRLCEGHKKMSARRFRVAGHISSKETLSG